MNGNVLYDAPGPRARKLERYGSIAVIVVLGALLALGIVGMIGRGLFDDRWQIFTSPPSIPGRVDQTAQDVWKNLLITGLGATLRAAVIAAPLALVLAFALSILRTSRLAILRIPAQVVIEFLRGMPVLLMMFFGLLAFGFDALGAVVFGLVMYNAAIVAEILRAGLAALPKGQVEAGTAIGLTRWQTLRIIQYPQVVRLMLPSLISQFVVLLKDTSLGFIVGYAELLRAMQLQYSYFGDRYRFPLFIVVLAIYLIVNFTLSRVAVVVERRLSSRGQKAEQTEVNLPVGATVEVPDKV